MQLHSPPSVLTYRHLSPASEQTHSSPTLQHKSPPESPSPIHVLITTANNALTPLTSPHQAVPTSPSQAQLNDKHTASQCLSHCIPRLSIKSHHPSYNTSRTTTLLRVGRLHPHPPQRPRWIPPRRLSPHLLARVYPDSNMPRLSDQGSTSQARLCPLFSRALLVRYAWHHASLIRKRASAWRRQNRRGL